MNNENILTEGQEVWVKARIAGSPIPDRDGEIKIYTTNSWDAYGEHYVLSSEIRTTEQICAEVIKEEEERLKNIGIAPPCDGQNAGREAPQNAELCEGDECWVKAKLQDPQPDRDGDYRVLIENNFTGEERVFVRPEHIRFSDPTHSTAVITFVKTDRTRKFRKGDKVRLVERWGRTPWLNCSNLELGETYTVYADEEVEDEEIYLEVYDNSEGISPFFLDLVEPTPEPKYWLHESPKTYSIYYKGQFGRVITAMLMQKDLYTLEEAQEQCEKLNKKEQNND